MKLTTIKIACATLLGAALLAWGDEPPDGTKTRVFGSGVLSDHLSMYDVDDSGGLSVEEYQALQEDRISHSRHDRFRSRWDTNRDGRIDARERQRAMERIRLLIEERRLRRFNEVDANSDGFLTEQEFLQINAVTTTDLDNPGVGAELFRHLDHDGDTRISKPEFLRSLNVVRPVPVGPDPVPKPRSDPEPDNPNSP